MMLSVAAYEKAQAILAYVSVHHNSSSKQIAEAIDYHITSTMGVLSKMVAAGVLSTQRQTITHGYQLLYSTTGKPLPLRTPVRAQKPPPPELMLKTEPVPAAHLATLPSFMRAITPVIEQPTANGVAVYGHTKEQHARQSAATRRDRKTRANGVMYTGEPRI